MTEVNKKEEDGFSKYVADLILSGHQLLQVTTTEECRCLADLQRVARDLLPNDKPNTPPEKRGAAWRVVVWDFVNGFHDAVKKGDGCEGEPARALLSLPTERFNTFEPKEYDPSYRPPFEPLRSPRAGVITDILCKRLVVPAVGGDAVVEPHGYSLVFDNDYSDQAQLQLPAGHGPTVRTGEHVKLSQPVSAVLDNNVLFIFLDCKLYFDLPESGLQTRRVLRSLLEAQSLSNTRFNRPIILLGVQPVEHVEVKDYIVEVPFERPTPVELANCVDYIVAGETSSSLLVRDGSDEEFAAFRRGLADAMRGFSQSEAHDTLAYLSRRHGGLSIGLNKDKKEAVLRSVHKRKREKWAGDRVLELIDLATVASMEEIGGYDLLKSWLKRQKMRFGDRPQALGVSPPKGMVLGGLPGTGKCFQKGTPILMFDGSVRSVEDVADGDLLMGPDSKPRRVLGTTCGHGPLYEVKPVKGSPYVVNADHVLSLKYSGLSGRPNPSRHKVINITVREYLELPENRRVKLKGWRTGVDWEERSVDIPPYVLGCWLGDGTARSFSVTTPDDEVVKAFAECASANGLSLNLAGRKGKASTYRIAKKNGGIGRNACFDALRRYGLLLNKHIPSDYLVNSRAVRLELLAGVVDSDGYISSGGCEMTLKRKQLADDIVFLARSLGFGVTVREVTKVCTNNGKSGRYQRIFISGDLSVIPSRVQRRKVLPRRQVKDVLVTGVTVTPVGDGDYFGFEVDGDHLFLLGDFTVTHNSACALAVAREFSLPLVELRFDAVFNSLVGSSESSMRDALARVKALGPCVVRVDEIDKGMSGLAENAGGDSGVGARVLGRFLSWLANENNGAFVVMTLNRLQGLPPELLRTGRVDRAWFVDLPNDDERMPILDIHLKKRGIDPSFLGSGQRAMLADATRGFSGSDLEQLVIESQVEALFRSEGNSATPDYEILSELSRTMKPSGRGDVSSAQGLEQMRSLFDGRAYPVSSPAGAVSAAAVKAQSTGRQPRQQRKINTQGGGSGGENN